MEEDKREISRERKAGRGREGGREEGVDIRNKEREEEEEVVKDERKIE